MRGRGRLVISGALRRVARQRPDQRLLPLKLRAIDHAFERLGCETVADLGGVWGVDAGYALYAADRHGARRVVICDDDFTPPVLERERRDGRVELVQGGFGTPEVAERVGSVDAILMLDVLLHQVRPDWDEILAMYAERARCLVLAGPWWNGDETVRLLELGRERYLEAVPMRELHEPIMDRLNELNERRGRPWRDCHDIWQWGITDADLRATAADLGLRLAYHENAGRWRGLEDFDDCSYVFVGGGGGS